MDSAGFLNSSELNNMTTADNLALRPNVIPLYKIWMLFQYTKSERGKCKNSVLCQLLRQKSLQKWNID